MTSNKYIVRNCPCFVKTFEWCQKVDDYGVCENTTDCLTKQIIDKCKYYQNKIGRTPQYRAGFVDATKDILQLFDIEEVNK
jgi:hypothetical protein